jgi:hypothetical protein
VLDEHLAHVRVAQRGVDGFLGVEQKLVFSSAKTRVVEVYRAFSIIPRKANNTSGKSAFELLYRGDENQQFRGARKLKNCFSNF